MCILLEKSKFLSRSGIIVVRYKRPMAMTANKRNSARNIITFSRFREAKTSPLAVVGFTAE